jgi:hypothetical protein
MYGDLEDLVVLMDTAIRAWIVGTRPTGVQRINEFLRGNLIALGDSGLGNLAGMDLAEIKRTLRQKRHETNEAKLGNGGRALNSFVNRMSKGDLVIVRGDGVVHIGEVRGEYKYEPKYDDLGYSHQRRMKWLIAVPRRELPQTIAKKLKAQQRILELDAGAVKELIHARDEGKDSRLRIDEVDTDGKCARLEGEETEAMGKRRTRDQILRRRKISQARNSGNGRLICEVPGCGFDFEEVYGLLGAGFAHVHHRNQLSGRNPRATKLKELAIVCPNCHAMIHRHGKCRPLKGLVRH